MHANWAGNRNSHFIDNHRTWIQAAAAEICINASTSIRISRAMLNSLACFSVITECGYLFELRLSLFDNAISARHILFNIFSMIGWNIFAVSLFWKWILLNRVWYLHNLIECTWIICNYKKYIKKSVLLALIYMDNRFRWLYVPFLVNNLQHHLMRKQNGDVCNIWIAGNATCKL